MRPHIRFEGNALVLLDQRRLPGEEVYVRCASHSEVADAIRAMVVRGAPAIGIAAAYGMALAARVAGMTLGAPAMSEQPATLVSGQGAPSPLREGQEEVERSGQPVSAPAQGTGTEAGTVEAAGRMLSSLRAARSTLDATRPTAVNLAWATARMLARAEALAASRSPSLIAGALADEARAIHAEDIAACRAMGRNGAALISDPASVLTHCNAGALATGGYGSALGVIRAAVEAGKRITVYADETRPFLQGARLTAWELLQDGIPVRLIADAAAGSLLARGRISCAVVGADRIARNGDTANKIGTYPLAVLCREHGVPLYVAAPLSTVDLAIESGAQIPIEERSEREVTHLGGARIAPEGVPAENPAFDVTPARLISAIVTERGVARAPYAESLVRLVE